MEDLRICYEVDGEKIEASFKSFVIDLRKRIGDYDFLVTDCFIRKD